LIMVDAHDGLRKGCALEFLVFFSSSSPSLSFVVLNSKPFITYSFGDALLVCWFYIILLVFGVHGFRNLVSKLWSLHVNSLPLSDLLYNTTTRLYSRSSALETRSVEFDQSFWSFVRQLYDTFGSNVSLYLDSRTRHLMTNFQFRSN
jgi:hypothetical protein